MSAQSDTQPIVIPQYLRSISPADAIPTDDADLFADIAVNESALATRVEHLEAVLADIASAARMLAEWVNLGHSDFAGVLTVAKDIIKLADDARPSATSAPVLPVRSTRRPL